MDSSGCVHQPTRRQQFRLQTTEEDISSRSFERMCSPRSTSTSIDLLRSELPVARSISHHSGSLIEDAALHRQEVRTTRKIHSAEHTDSLLIV